MRTVEKIAVFLLVALLPFQDTFLQKTPMRNVGASLSVFPLVVLLLVKVLARVGRLDFRVGRVGLRCTIYALVLTSVYLVMFGVTMQETSLILKSMNMFAIVGLFGFGAMATKGAERKWLAAGAAVGFAFTLLASVLGGALDGNSLLHATVNLDSRPRGFCTESSTFSVQVVISGLLATYMARRKLSKGLLLGATMGLLMLSGSKGGLISLLLCCGVYWVMRVGLSPVRLVLGAAVLVPMGYFVGGMIAQGFDNDMISEGSSVATRATMALFAWVTVSHHPLGVGFGGFYPALPRYLPDAMAMAKGFFNFPLIFVEVSNYQYTAENADCKALFLDFAVFFGLPFMVAFFVFFFRLCRALYREQQQILLIGALFSATALLSYYSSMNAYSIPVLIGICLWGKHADAALRLGA